MHGQVRGLLILSSTHRVTHSIVWQSPTSQVLASTVVELYEYVRSDAVAEPEALRQTRSCVVRHRIENAFHRLQKTSAN